MCGENKSVSIFSPSAIGSPPRVRGKLLLSCTGVAGIRITPACAGKTKEIYNITEPSRDHPRVCGENQIFLTGARFVRGSPPRVRGKLIHLSGFHSSQGITPACAGKTEYDGKPTLATRDHPRVCGENSEANVSSSFAQGSPPRVRGKLQEFPNQSI